MPQSWKAFVAIPIRMLLHKTIEACLITRSLLFFWKGSTTFANPQQLFLRVILLVLVSQTFYSHFAALYWLKWQEMLTFLGVSSTHHSWLRPFSTIVEEAALWERFLVHIVHNISCWMLLQTSWKRYAHIFGCFLLEPVKFYITDLVLKEGAHLKSIKFGL